MAKILIKNGRIWDGEKFFYGDILTCNEKIADIGNEINETADFIYDAKNKIVAPGLVDIHVHMKGVSSDDFGIQAEMSSLPFGVTSVADAGACQGDKKFLNSSGVKNTVFVYAHIKNNLPDFTYTNKHLYTFGEKVSGIKVCYDFKQNKEIKDITPLKEICEFAHSKGLLVMVHSSDCPIKMSELLNTLDKGDIVTHAYHFGGHNVSEDNFECIKNAKERGIIIDVGFAGHVHTDFKVLADAVKCGALPDTISTDITKFSAYKRGGKYGMTMCMSILKDMGMNEDDIFKAVTQNAAIALKKENE